MPTGRKAAQNYNVIAIIHCDEQIIDSVHILWCLLYIKQI